jgi:hypothetical protein
VGDIRFSQVVVEVLTEQAEAPEFRVSQLIVDVLTEQAPAPEFRVSQVLVDVLSSVTATGATAQPFNALSISP